MKTSWDCYDLRENSFYSKNRLLEKKRRERVRCNVDYFNFSDPYSFPLGTHTDGTFFSISHVTQVHTNPYTSVRNTERVSSFKVSLISLLLVESKHSSRRYLSLYIEPDLEFKVFLHNIKSKRAKTTCPCSKDYEGTVSGTRDTHHKKGLVFNFYPFSLRYGSWNRSSEQTSSKEVTDTEDDLTQTN